MPVDSDRTNRRLIVSGAILAPLVILCILYLDVPLALFVRDHLYANPRWAATTADLPDLLLMVVVLSTFGSWALYLLRSRKGIFNEETWFAREVLWLAPASYLAKALLKMVFGRSNTRYWLQDPGLYGFHWFQMKRGCEGFPSGHMLVIIALLAALWRHYPKTRPFCIVTATVLGAALIATNYHFLSDVIAGAYLAIVLEVVLFRLLFPAHRRGADQVV